MKSEMNRRDFMKTGTVAGLGATGPGRIPKGQPENNVRMGFIGVGGRGTTLLKICLTMEDVEIPAICDITKKNLHNAQALVEGSGRKKPEGYFKDEEIFNEMVARDDLDGVVIASPWEWHAPMAIATMKAGKYAAPEVGAASSVDECWQLVRTSEETGMPCMMLENSCFERPFMAVLRMIREGIFGEILHCQGAYEHDLRGRIVKGKGTGVVLKEGGDYRTRHNRKRNGNIYPTHAIGPIATWLNIDRGNRFQYLTATATKSRGLHDWTVRNLGKNHRFADIDWIHGDVVTSVIKCQNGESIIVNHDTNLPRPHTDMTRVQGTRGVWMNDSKTIHIEGRSPRKKWESFKPYQSEFEHPLWQRYLREGVRKGGHGGIDHLTLRSLVESIKSRSFPPIDVYDTASWRAITPLSEQSVALGSQPIPFPDFTDGKWMYKNRPIFGLT